MNTPDIERDALAYVNEENETDDEERLRRIKEREVMVFLSYLKIKMEEEKTKEEQERIATKLYREFMRMHLLQIQKRNDEMLKSIAAHDERVRNFLFSDDNSETKAQRDELLKNAGMTQDEYSALAMAGLCESREIVEEAGKIFAGKEYSSKLKEKRTENLKRAGDAVLDFSKGNVKKMEKILKDGLINACHAFSTTKDTLTAIHWSRQINAIISVVGSHPVLFKDGATTPLLTAAAGMSAIGKVLENGIESLNTLCNAQLKGVKLAPETEENLQQQVLLMHSADEQRSDETFQNLFAKTYSPKKRIKQENIDSLLKKLGKSQAMHDLSAMDSDKKMFVLTDEQSCKDLSTGLFTVYEEKNKASLEPVKEKNKAVSVH